ALVELAPTMVSGPMRLEFDFAEGEVRRHQTLEAWVIPGDQKWTLVGLAEGSVGAQTVADNMERHGRFNSDLGDKARVAFYANGRVLGRYLLTVAYDSAKQKDDQRLLGAIDPNAYYTVYADRSDRRFDAASREKLYVRLEGRAFFALFGDFATGFDETDLARYQRTLTGGSGEIRLGALRVRGFAARTGQAHRRDEIQGAGISGPYRLSSRDLVAGSETVMLEVRDRFRSELIVSQRTLVRYLDYDIDLLSGTITFKEPLLSRDADLNPQFVVIDFDVATPNASELNAGLRTSLDLAGGKVRIGATAITDTGARGDGKRTELAAVDLKVKLGGDSELRAEAAASRSSSETRSSWLAEYERHGSKFDLLAYARSAEDGFGLGQTNRAEIGRRKFGVDARYLISQAWSITGSSWYDQGLSDGTTRKALQLSTTYRTLTSEFRAGISRFDDRTIDGSAAASTVVEGGATRRLFDNRLELSGSASIALGNADSVDLPARYRLGARFAVTNDVKLTGLYEIAKGTRIDARTARLGLEVEPWSGSRITGGIGQQDLGENGNRAFAAFGIAQSVQVSKALTIDVTLDSAKTLGGTARGALVNSEHPLSSGGILGEGNTLGEDFVAVTLGGSYRAGRWAISLRGEMRNGEFADRRGMTFGAIRQLGEGQMVGAGFSWTRATGANGAMSEVFDGAMALAWRPAKSSFAFLSKVELRGDKVSGAVAGDAGPVGTTALTIDGAGLSRRIIASLSTNWSPKGHDDLGMYQRSEIGLFMGVRHSFERLAGFDLPATSLLGGIDARLGLGEHLDLGVVATARRSLQDGTTALAIGPQIGVSPAKDLLLTIGYNFTGFRDRDFSASRNTDKGLFATMKLKFGADSFNFLGLKR
ncbi:MAG: hypothetical protein ACKOUT_15960, partial [Novosphingobium sp.]